MLRIHLSAADLAVVRFASRPAALHELHIALMMMVRRDADLLFGRWRRRMLRALPAAVGPLRDLVPTGIPPAFLDHAADATTVAQGVQALREAPAALVRSELERVYATAPGTPPAWVRDLHGDGGRPWTVLAGAERAAFESVLRPGWDRLSDLHHAEFARYALIAAHHGVAAGATAVVPGLSARAGVWELPATRRGDLRVEGRGLVLRPSFHWTGPALVVDLPGEEVVVTYPAGGPLPPPLTTTAADPLAVLIGRTRVEVLRLLDDGLGTGELARRVGISAATVSAHTAALRDAGLITTARTGRSVRHRRTALGTLLLRGGPLTP